MYKDTLYLYVMTSFLSTPRTDTSVFLDCILLQYTSQVPSSPKMPSKLDKLSPKMSLMASLSLTQPLSERTVASKHLSVAVGHRRALTYDAEEKTLSGEDAGEGGAAASGGGARRPWSVVETMSGNPLLVVDPPRCNADCGVATCWACRNAPPRLAMNESEERKTGGSPGGGRGGRSQRSPRSPRPASQNSTHAASQEEPKSAGELTGGLDSFGDGRFGDSEEDTTRTPNLNRYLQASMDELPLNAQDWEQRREFIRCLEAIANRHSCETALLSALWSKVRNTRRFVSL